MTAIFKKEEPETET